MEPTAIIGRVKMFSCVCGCRDEGTGDAPLCWGCTRQMRLWSTRNPERASSVLQGASADTRTANGGY